MGDRGQIGDGFVWVSVVVIVIVLIVGFVTLHAAADRTLDDLCNRALGPNVTAVDDQPLFDQRLDCRFPNGTAVRGAEPRPMNVTS